MSAPQAPPGALVDAALRCYPARWRRRHADEAAELAVLLIRDGRPRASIAWSYLLGAAREWLTPRPGRSLSTATATLLVATCILGFSAALVAETAPARAAGRVPSGSTPSNIRPTPQNVDSTSSHLPTRCRHALPARTVDATPAASHSQLTIGGTAHARSC